MTKKQKERCRWTTKKETQCKNPAVGNTRLCYRHNITVRFKTHLIIGIIILLVGAVISFFVPHIRRIITPERTLFEKIKIEGNNAIKIKDRTQAAIYGHELHDLGVEALGNGDYGAYHQAIWQMLRLHEFCLRPNWPNDPTTSLVRNEVSEQIVLLITAKRLELMHWIQISGTLGNVALAGTEASINNYNEGKFFSDLLFTATLEIMKRAIDTLWAKKNYEFARFISGSMTNVIFAEGHRRLDQGYRICPGAGDRPQVTLSGERIADVGQPRDLDSFYKACHIISRLPGPLFRAFIDKAKYDNLRICFGKVKEEKEDTIFISQEVRKRRYYHPRGCVSGKMESFTQQFYLDSLVSICNQRGQEAADCVKQLVKRERHIKI